MLISKALAQDTTPPAAAVPATDTTATTGAMADAPNVSSVVTQNIGMIVLLVAMFYFLLIRPQQRRFKDHKLMIDALKVGDKVVTSGGLIGRIDTIIDKDEVIVDLGNNMKVTAVRSTIQAKPDKTAIVAKK